MRRLFIIISLFTGFFCATHSASARGSAAIRCVQNLQEIKLAQTVWAVEKDFDATNAFTISINDPAFLKYLSSSQMPVCRNGGTYSLGRTPNDQPVCSYHGTADTAAGVQRKVEDALGRKWAIGFSMVGAICVATVLRAKRLELKNFSSLSWGFGIAIAVLGFGFTRMEEPASKTAPILALAASCVLLLSMSLKHPNPFLRSTAILGIVIGVFFGSLACFALLGG